MPDNRMQIREIVTPEDKVLDSKFIRIKTSLKTIHTISQSIEVEDHFHVMDGMREIGMVAVV